MNQPRTSYAAIHVLKTDIAAWDAIERGEKTAEFRCCLDRDFQVGDIMRLYRGTLTHRGIPVIDARITHIVDGPDFGIPEGYVMLSFCRDALDPKPPGRNAAGILRAAAERLERLAQEAERFGDE